MQMYSNNSSHHNISVIYLSYIPYGTKFLIDFINSYQLHNSGYNHDLIIVFKGMKTENDIAPFTKILEQQNILFIPLFYKGNGFDINAFHWASTHLKSEFMFFLNTRSLLLNKNWITYFIDNFETKTGIISATASFQSHYSSVFQKNKLAYETNKTLYYNFRKYKLFLKAFFYWRFLFKPFPNPHLRTNAFMIKRDVFLKIKMPKIKNKLDAYKFESGRNSLTAQIIKMGYDVLLIDKNGKTYTIPEWPNSHTFWKGHQENLLIADNQTRAYDEADETEKKLMTKLAWGNNE